MSAVSLERRRWGPEINMLEKVQIGVAVRTRGTCIRMRSPITSCYVDIWVSACSYDLFAPTTSRVAPAVYYPAPMSPVAPWEVDEDPVNTLTQHLRQSKVECSALLEQINRKNEEVSLFRKAREDAETHARHEELRANALEEKASKALDVRQFSVPSHTSIIDQGHI